MNLSASIGARKDDRCRNRFAPLVFTPPAHYVEAKRNNGAQQHRDQFADKCDMVVALLLSSDRTANAIQETTGWTSSNVDRVLLRLQETGRITREWQVSASKFRQREWVYRRVSA